MRLKIDLNYKPLNPSKMKYQIAISNQWGQKKAFTMEFRNEAHYLNWLRMQDRIGNKVIHTSLAR